jgi:hypothetical protein
MFIGSMPNPSNRNAPNIQITATSAQNTVSDASFTDAEYANSNNHVNAMVTKKNTITDFAPVLISPTILEKPMIATVVFVFSYFERIASS